MQVHALIHCLTFLMHDDWLYTGEMPLCPPTLSKENEEGVAQSIEMVKVLPRYRVSSRLLHLEGKSFPATAYCCCCNHLEAGL